MMSEFSIIKFSNSEDDWDLRPSAFESVCMVLNPTMCRVWAGVSGMDTEDTGDRSWSPVLKACTAFLGTGSQHRSLSQLESLQISCVRSQRTPAPSGLAQSLTAIKPLGAQHTLCIFITSFFFACPHTEMSPLGGQRFCLFHFCIPSLKNNSLHVLVLSKYLLKEEKKGEREEGKKGRVGAPGCCVRLRSCHGARVTGRWKCVRFWPTPPWPTGSQFLFCALRTLDPQQSAQLRGAGCCGRRIVNVVTPVIWSFHSGNTP